MKDDKLRFQCPHCGKSLSVASKHSGKVLACPKCKTKVQVPEPAMAGKQTRQKADANASDANAKSTAAKSTAGQSSKSSATRPAKASRSGITADSKTAKSKKQKTAAPKTAQQTPAAKATAKPRSGISAACIVAAICAIAWLGLVVYTGSKLGIFALVTGLLVGLVAGLIRRERSVLFSGIVATISTVSVLLVKAILIVAIALVGQYLYQYFKGWNSESEKHTHALADKMLSEGKFYGEEKEFAEVYVRTYFSRTGKYEPAKPDSFEVSDQVKLKLIEQLGKMRPEYREDLISDSHRKHPEWIEDERHFLAAADQLLNKEGALRAELKAHAGELLNELAPAIHDPEYDALPEPELRKRTIQLRAAAGSRLKNKSKREIDEILRDAMRRHPHWNAFPDAQTAMLVKLHNENHFSGDLAEQARFNFESNFDEKSVEVLEAETQPEPAADQLAEGDEEQVQDSSTETNPVSDATSDDAFDIAEYQSKNSQQELARRQQEIEIAANNLLAEMDRGARKELIAATQQKYPGWNPETNDKEAMMRKFDLAFVELEKVGGDGTFSGSVWEVFGARNIAWIFLGILAAFGLPWLLGRQPETAAATEQSAKPAA